MRDRAKVCAVLAVATMFVAGCEETAKKQVQVRPPAATPAPTPEYVSQPLPLPQHPIASDSLSPALRPQVDILVAKVQTSYDSGQSDFKAKDLEKAQADFDRAADLILKSGFPVDSDPRLSKLSDEIGEAVQSGDLSVTKDGGDEAESDTPAEPAPIDEIADLTAAVGRSAPGAEGHRGIDERSARYAVVRERFGAAIPELLHQTERRAINCRDRLAARGPLRRNDSAGAEGRGHAAGFDLSGAGRKSAFQPQAVSRAGARGIWQFMPFRGQEYDSSAVLVDR